MNTHSALIKASTLIAACLIRYGTCYLPRIKLCNPLEKEVFFTQCKSLAMQLVSYEGLSEKCQGPKIVQKLGVSAVFRSQLPNLPSKFGMFYQFTFQQPGTSPIFVKVILKWKFPKIEQMTTVCPTGMVMVGHVNAQVPRSVGTLPIDSINRYSVKT